MTKTRRDVLAVVGDMHVGSTTALCPPTADMDDGGHYKASKAQCWLYQCWCDYWAQVMAVKPTGGGKRYVVCLGDAMEGDHHATSAVVSANPATMLQIAGTVLEPARKWANHFFMLRGTEAHGGEAGAWDEILADDLNAERCPDTGRASWWHIGIEISGVVFDCAHHPPSAPGRVWTRANAAATLAYTVFSEYAEHGQRAPDVALRGHVHKFADSGHNYPTRGVLCPAWQLATPYSSRRWPGVLAHIGGLLFMVEAGEAHMRHIRFAPERSQPWTEAAWYREETP